MLLHELEDGNPLRTLGQEIWNFIEGLEATIDQRSEPGYHLARRNGSHFLSFRFVGAKAQVFPRHSLVLVAPWNDSFQNIPGIKRGSRTWHDGPSAELGVQPGQGEIAQQFIRLAYDQARG